MHLAACIFFSNIISCSYYFHFLFIICYVHEDSLWIICIYFLYWLLLYLLFITFCLSVYHFCPLFSAGFIYSIICRIVSVYYSVSGNNFLLQYLIFIFINFTWVFNPNICYFHIIALPIKLLFSPEYSVNIVIIFTWEFCLYIYYFHLSILSIYL